MSEQIKSRPLSREGRDNYDSIFRKEGKPEPEVRAEDSPPRDGLEEREDANVDLPDTAAQDSASKSNSPAVSG